MFTTTALNHIVKPLNQNNMTEIEVLINRLSETDLDQKIERYFGKRLRHRSKYYSQMRMEATKYLWNKGIYSKVRIAEMVYGNRDRHDAIIHNLQKPDIFDADQVKECWKDWINEEVYPTTEHLYIKQSGNLTRLKLIKL